MAGLPHWDNSQAARNYYEPLFLNQFNVIITPPAIIVPNVELLVEHVIEVDGLPEKAASGTPVVQKYKFADRNYAAGLPDATSFDLTMNFEVNLNEENNMYIYNILRAWSDLIYDPLNGRQGLKKDYVGESYVEMHNKAGSIYREFRFKPVFIMGPLTPMKLNYVDNNIYKVTAKFKVDAYKETRVGQIVV